MSNHTEAATFAVGQPPEPITSDYLEMGILVFLFALGAPLNLAAYTQLSERGVHSRLDLLKQHLNYSDLLVIFIYVPSRSLWLLTYDWRGGNFLCKIIKYMQGLSFQASSNIIVCIALDRLLSVLSPTHQIPIKAQRRTKLLLALSWIISILICAPQLYVWSEHLPFPQQGWHQCTQMWSVDKQFMSAAEAAEYDATSHETLYNIAHVCLVFWIPMAIIIVCYIIVLTWVWLNSQPSTCSTRLSLHITSTTSKRNQSLATETIETNLGKDWKQSTAEEPLTFNKPRIVITNSRDECMQPLTDRENTPVKDGQRQSNSSIQGPKEHYGNSQSYHARITRSRAIRVSFILVAAYIICWLPYNLLTLLNLFKANIDGIIMDNIYFLHGLVVLNSVINPYLYGLFGPIFWRPLRARAEC